MVISLLFLHVGNLTPLPGFLAHGMNFAGHQLCSLGSCTQRNGKAALFNLCASVSSAQVN